MKYLCLTFCVFMCNLTHIISQQKVYEHTVDFVSEDFNLNSEQDGLFHITSHVYDLHFSEDIKSPAIPYVCIDIPSEYGDNVISVESDIIDSSVYGVGVLESNYVISNIDSNIFTEKYDSTKVYPLSQLKTFELNHIDGCYILSILYSPFRYNAKTKIIEIVKRVKFKIGIVI